MSASREGRLLDAAALVIRQVEGIARWTALRRAREQELAEQLRRSRETRPDAARELDALGVAQEVLEQRLAEQLAADCAPLKTALPPRMLVAHRHEWFRDKLAAALNEVEAEVEVLVLGDGAEALGVLVAEQPDVLLVEERLPRVSGTELGRIAADVAPHTCVAAQAAGDEEARLLREAQIAVVFARHVPPSDVAQQLVALVDPGAARAR